MIYAKIQGEHEALFFSGRVLRDGGDVISNPTEKTLRERGYFPLREVGEPRKQTGFRSLPCFREEGGEVILTYEQKRDGEADL